jgi:type VI secretion system protein ImpB
MAKESSVAPRERVNIVYKPATGGAQEEIELPLVQLVMGDFTLRQDGRPLEERGEPINVDKDNFNKVMREQKLELNFTVPNRLSEQEGDELPVNLRFETLKDFSPESVAAQVPELKKLTELRDALTALKGPLANVPGFRKQLQKLLEDDAAREQLMKELGMTPENKE